MGRLKMNTNSSLEFSISSNSIPFTIAEAGLNHNGEIEKAFEMIKIAKTAGVDAIKFQTFKANEIVVDESLTFTYKSQGKMITESQMELFKRCELDRDDFFEIKKACDKEKILFLSTPQNPSDLELLLELGITAIKIGSDDFTNIPLMEQYCKADLPLIMSCGMANIDEIKQTLKCVSAKNDNQVVLMLTTSQYPTPPENVNLLKLRTLSKTFPNVILGYSDHTEGVLASSLAVAFGAKVFEKHFTIDKNLPGPDQWFAEDATGLKLWSNSIKTSHKLLGSSQVKPTVYEEKMKVLARRSIVALTDIENNEIFTEENIGLRRPGNGLPPIMFKNIKGKKSSRKLLKGELVMDGDFL